MRKQFSTIFVSVGFFFLFNCNRTEIPHKEFGGFFSGHTNIVGQILSRVFDSHSFFPGRRYPVLYSNHDNTLVSIGNRNDLIVWDIDSAEIKKSYSLDDLSSQKNYSCLFAVSETVFWVANSKEVFRLEFLPNGNNNWEKFPVEIKQFQCNFIKGGSGRLYLGLSERGKFQLWNLLLKKKLFDIETGSEFIHKVDFDIASGTIAINHGMNPDNMTIYNFHSILSVYQIDSTGKSNPIPESEEKYIVSQSMENSPDTLEGSRWVEKNKTSISHWVVQMQITNNFGLLYATGLQGSKVQYFPNILNLAEKQSLRFGNEFSLGEKYIAILENPERKNADPHLQLFEWKEGISSSRSNPFSPHKAPVNFMIWNPVGNILFTSSKDQLIKSWVISD